MISTNRINESGKGLPLSFLVMVLVLVACATRNSIDEPPVTIAPSAAATSTVPVSPTASVSPTATEVDAAALVEARVREIGAYDESIPVEVEEETSVVALPGLSLYVATAPVPDAGGDHCAVYGEEAWCHREALHNIVRQFALGANPDQLSDKEWLALISFFSRTPLEGPDDLEMIDRFLPDSERAKIRPPVINRPGSGGAEITYYFEDYSYDSFPGPMALGVMNIVVTDDNTVTVQSRDVWFRPETDE